LTATWNLACRLSIVWFAATAVMAAPPPAVNPGRAVALREARLRLHHTHTGERIDVVFRRGDAYIPEALARLSHHLRDHLTGEVMDIDPGLFDLLADLSDLVGRPGETIEVICGYRSRATNEWLRQHSSGVASRSLHMQGLAVDIRMPGVRTSALRDAALSLQRGGVGYYPDSDFIHVDVGPVRHW
jgi:uncharacterized protein YcbK (DUF882 family)